MKRYVSYILTLHRTQKTKASKGNEVFLAPGFNSKCRALEQEVKHHCAVRVQRREHNAINIFYPLSLHKFSGLSHTRQNLFKDIVISVQASENVTFLEMFSYCGLFCCHPHLALLLLFNLKQCSYTQCQKFTKKVSLERRWISRKMRLFQ